MVLGIYLFPRCWKPSLKFWLIAGSQSVMAHAQDLMEGMMDSALDFVTDFADLDQTKAKSECTLYKNETACKTSIAGTCIWCGEMGKPTKGRCVKESRAKWLPLPIFDCKHPTEDMKYEAHTEVTIEEGDDSQVSFERDVSVEVSIPAMKDTCKTNVNETSCVTDPQGTCVWCAKKGVTSPTLGKCVNETKAGWLPAPFYQCTVPKLEPPTPKALCKTLMDEASCDGSPMCSWCT